MNTEWKPIGAHWYAVDAHGAATLCTCEEDARETAAESAQMFPNCAPYTAVQLAPVFAPTSHPIPTGATGEEQDADRMAVLYAAGTICRHLDMALDQSKVMAAARDIAQHFAAPAAGDALNAERYRALLWLVGDAERFRAVTASVEADREEGFTPGNLNRLADAAIAQQSQRKEA